MTWGLGSIISPSIVKAIGIKFCLVMGGLSNTIWIMCSLFAIVEAKEYENININFF